MLIKRMRTPILISGALLLVLAGLLAAQSVFANPAAAPLEQASALHPSFALLDASGANVLQSGAPLSTMETCGQCHDTEYIASHSFHTDLGRSEQTAAGALPGSQAWETSPGLYGGWDPLTYRYLSPSGDSQPDLTPQEWVAFNAARLVGGGPAEIGGVEMNCFLCHLTEPDNAARIAAIQSGQGIWASSATLAQMGISVPDGAGYAWNPEAFTADGLLQPAFVQLQDPSNQNCAQCHGLVHTDQEEPLLLAGCELDQPHTATTGQIISGQKIAISGMNLSEKNDLTRAWDIHAERGLSCTDCHYSLNNPVYAGVDAGAPEHLQFDPRRLEIGEYLQMPEHNFARGQSAQNNLAADLKGSMRRCETCHDASTHADWLPYVERHMAVMACESCHVPQLYAPAVQSADWTVLTSEQGAAVQCRGVDANGSGSTDSLSALVTGFQPVLMQRTNIDGGVQLAPYNLAASWYWVGDTADGPRPVQMAQLEAAYFENGGYAAEVLQTLDLDGNGQLDDSELRLDTQAKAAVIAGRLSDLGVQNPRIEGMVQPYSINHNVINGEWVTRDCQSCHSDNSRLAASLTLSDYLPGEVMPVFAADANTLPAPGLQSVDGALVYSPDTEAQGLYVFGHNRVDWIDWFGSLFFVGVLLGVAGHGGLRAYAAWKAPKHAAPTRKVYMYAVYERFWHWLQTLAIVLLLFTGLVIHRPEIFGWLSFRYMVTVHNVLAAVLVINAALSLFYHLASGEIKQFIPRPYGFFDQAIVQAKFYLQGIFSGAAHPFEKTPDKKMNPLQQATYFGILNVLLPLQIITGALMWGVQQWPQVANALGGLPWLAPFHSLVAWTFAAFIVGHVYLTTTGHEPLAGIKAMIQGWEDVEAEHDDVQAEEAAPSTDETPGEPGVLSSPAASID